MRFSWSQPGRRVGFLEASGLMGITILVVARFFPVHELPFWRCLLFEYTGWPCLGCGLTRAAQWLSHGELAAALAINPLGTMIYILLSLVALAALSRALFGLRLPEVELTTSQARTARLLLGFAIALNYAWVRKAL